MTVYISFEENEMFKKMELRNLYEDLFPLVGPELVIKVKAFVDHALNQGKKIEYIGIDVPAKHVFASTYLPNEKRHNH